MEGSKDLAAAKKKVAEARASLESLPVNGKDPSKFVGDYMLHLAAVEAAEDELRARTASLDEAFDLGTRHHRVR
jgi:hypothetical protein